MLKKLLLLSCIILLTGCSAVTKKDTEDILPPAEPVINGIKEGETYQQSVSIDVLKVAGVTYNASINDFTYDLGTIYSYLGDHVFKLKATKLSNGLSIGVTINFTITQNISQQTHNVHLYGNLHAWSNRKGQSLLVTDNCNIEIVDGAWDGTTNTGSGGAATWDQVGTHTIYVSSEKMMGQKTGGNLISDTATSINFYSIANYSALPKGSAGQYDGSDAHGNYWDLKVRVNGVHGLNTGTVTTVKIYDTYDSADFTINDIINAITDQVEDVTATSINGNILLSHNKAGNQYTIEVDDNIDASIIPADFGIADLLFADNPDTAVTEANFGAKYGDWSAADIVWDYTPADSGSTGFTYNDMVGPGPTELVFSGSDTAITGMDGVIIGADIGGFNDGIITIETQPAETFSKTITVYDSLLAPREMTLTFERVAENQWSWKATGTGVGGSGVIDFNNQGYVLDVSATAVSMTGINGSSSQTIDLGLRDITQLYGTSNLNTYLYY